MNNKSYKYFLLSSFFSLINLVTIHAQDAAPDLSAANVLCDKETAVTISQFVGAGTDTDEATDGCLDAITETNTTWFVWEAADFGSFTFNIDPADESDLFAFSLFSLPNGLLDGTGKGNIRCVSPCRTGDIGLRAGDSDTDGGDCTDTDGFLRPLELDQGRYYGLMIENTTSNSGFTITFGGDGPIVSPTGQIQPDVVNACYGQPIELNQNIDFKNGNIQNYEWLVEGAAGQSEGSGFGATQNSFTYNIINAPDAEAGDKNVFLTVTTSIDGTNQTCTATFNTQITIDDCCDSENSVAIIDTTISPIACPSDANGAIDLQVNSPNPLFPNSYAWSNGATTEDIDQLAPDTYSVTVSNEAGCRDSLTYTFINPDALTVRDTIQQIPSCRGGTDGRIAIIANGGRTPYTYDFGDGNGFVNNNFLENLPIGDYTVVTMDASGCTDTTRTELDEKELIVTLENVVNPTCFDTNNGIIDISASNFTGTLQFDLNDGQGPVGADALTMLDSGSYTIDVIDSEGCMGGPIDTVLTKPAPFSLASIETRPGITCNGANDGTAVVSISGGTPDYTYAWSTGATTRSISNLSPGFYTVTITDANGCTIEQTSSELVDPPVLTATVATDSDVSCSDRNDGQIVLDVDGGTAPYFYNIGGLSVRDTILSDLSTGDYDITVTDNNDCEVIIPTVSINSPAIVDFTTNVNVGGGPSTGTGSSICYGQPIEFSNVSSFTVGTLESVSWDFGDSRTSDENNPEIAFTTIGTPTITLSVTSDLGCTETLMEELAFDIAPCCETDNSIILLPDLTPPLCNGGNNGSINVNPNSINAPITSINWTTNENTAEIDGLAAGNYGVTITNDATCEESTFLTLPEPPPITATLNVSQPTCDAAENGRIIVTAQGGTINAGSDYNFDFNNNGYSTNNVATDLPTGALNIMIRDDNNCEVPFDTLLAADPTANPITANLAINSPSCDAATNGLIRVNAVGNGPFLYNFDGSSFADIDSSANLTVGNYRVVVQDADNCELAIDTSLNVPDNFVPVTATITQVNLPSCGGGTDGSFTVVPDGELGNDVANYTFDFGNGGASPNNTVDNIAADQPVLVVITNANNCSTTLDTTLSELVLEPDNPLVEQPRCFGETNGRIRIQVPAPQGVAAPFTYAVNGGAFADEAVLADLGEGDYTVIVRDANNCVSEPLMVNVPQPDAINLMVVPQEISCFGADDGQITADVTGGNGNFIFDWSNGQATRTATSLPPDDYFVTVTDFRGCRDSTTSATTLIEPAELLASLGTVSPVLCFGETNGSISVDAIGGSAPYEYSLDGVLFQPSATLSNLSAGDYNVVIRDSRGCEVPVEDITVEEPGEFTVTANVDSDIAKLGFAVSLSASAATTAIGPVNYVWSTPDSIVCNGCSSFEFVPPGSTTFTVTAINSDNCQATDMVTVRVSLDRPVYIPNIFSPNGDGMNDAFYIPFSPSMTSIKNLRIFDRTGALVFEVNDINRGEELTKAWDGAFNGSEYRQGVFVVTAEINFVDGQTLPFQSDLTLITSE
ncbi:MAG: gliding motility-associated C-terminal domain-containing protein [Bacteroidota bacterium]